MGELDRLALAHQPVPLGEQLSAQHVGGPEPAKQVLFTAQAVGVERVGLLQSLEVQHAEVGEFLGIDAEEQRGHGLAVLGGGPWVRARGREQKSLVD